MRFLWKLNGKKKLLEILSHTCGKLILKYIIFKHLREALHLRPEKGTTIYGKGKTSGTLPGAWFPARG